eukprot:s2076_g10.t1
MALHQPLQQVLQGPHPGARVLLEGPPGLEQSRPSRVADEPVSQETLNYISQRVNSMLGHATTSSEWQVRAELRRMQPSFTAMKEKIQRVDMLLNAKVKGKEPVSQENLDRFLANIDQRREQELSLVKRDLHHTIMGHNHNADLMADHKVAIGTIYGMIEELHEDKPDKPALAQVLDDLAIFFNVSLVSALFLPGLELVVEASEAPFVQPAMKLGNILFACIGKRSFSICYRFQLRLRERWVNRMSIIYWTVVRQFCSGSTTSLHQLQLPCTIIRQAYHQDTAWLTCHPMGHQIPTWVAGFQGICLWVILSIPASAFDTFQCGCLEIRDRHCLYGLPGP